ncbi:hypothetical protein [Kitasatospora sp. NPDC091207]|uniref:hypothetical protein n=1 Tax=Kitasatospora sp. NPDC091207 TaxID=3364083 RepID=UPI0038169C8E
MSTTRRRALGPGAARVLTDTVRAPRTPPPWSPATLDAGLRGVLDAYEEAAAPRREAFEDLDEDVLAEAAAEARAFGTDPNGAVDALVRGLLLQLTEWQRTIDALGRDLTAAARERPLPAWAADAGRTEDIRWHQARTALLEAVTRHHHGGPAPVAGTGRPW